MNPILLIAWREYRQYIFSRGFLLYLLLMPIGAIVVAGMFGLAESARPIRDFAIYDASGRYEQGLADEFERAPAYGWQGDGARFDWPTLRQAKDRELARLESIYRDGLARAGVRTID